LFTGNKQKTRQLIKGFTFSTHSKANVPQVQNTQIQNIITGKHAQIQDTSNSICMSFSTS